MRSHRPPIAPRVRTRPGIQAELCHYQREARELAAILDTATDGVVVLDAQGRILTLNRSGEALFGVDQAEVAGESLHDPPRPGKPGAARSLFRRPEAHGVASLLNDGREIVGPAAGRRHSAVHDARDRRRRRA